MSLVIDPPPPEASEAPPPAPEDFRRVRYSMPDGDITGLAFGDETRPVDVVFVHATGFNARTYRTLLAPLGERLHVVAIDARGHGGTTLPAKLFGYASWARHRDDVIALLERHFDHAVTLAGHSMGATVSLMAAGRRPDLVHALALIEPVILPPMAYGFTQLPFAPAIGRSAFPIARSAARRRAKFPDRTMAKAALTGRGIFKSFSPEMLDDYLGDGLVEAPGGGLKLACAPAYEAATFAAQRNDPWRALRKVSAPLVVLRAEIGSTLPEFAARRFGAMRRDARIATVEGATHALPMERPDRARAAIAMAALMATP